MKKFILSVMLASTAISIQAADFFSTDKPDQLCTFGARIGLNTSNRTIGKDARIGYNHQGWGIGFDLGVVADLHIRDYISIQPGFFYESRSNSYALVSQHPFAELPSTYSLFNQTGIFNSYHFTIPILASVHFNITDDLRWNVEAGPYLSIVLNSKLKNDVLLQTPEPTPLNPLMEPGYQWGEFDQKAKTAELGLKIGTGLTLFRKYSFSVHYMAGGSHAWKDIKHDSYKYTYGGHAKSWVFTLGYDL